MRDFNSKLNNALSEMAQLSAWRAEFIKPEVIGWQASIGKRTVGAETQKYLRLMGLDETKKDEALQRAKNFVDDMVNNRGVGPDKLGTDSYQELVDSIVLTPIYKSNPTFDPNDVKALSSPKAQQAIAGYLNSNPAGYRWNFLIIDSAKLARMGIALDDFRRNYASAVARFAIGRSVTIDDHITFVKTSSSGDTLDADMLIHTVGHAVMDDAINTSISKYLLDLLNRTIEAARDVTGFDPVAKHNDLRALSMFLHFRAAYNLLEYQRTDLPERKRNAFKARALQSIEEGLYEMTSVYVKRNRVRFSPNKYCQITDKAFLGQVAAAEAEINDKMRAALDNCVGRIIVD